MPYIVISKTKSNHKKVEGLFEQEKLAKIYCDMMNKNEKTFVQPSDHNPLLSYHVEEHAFKDNNPELIEYVMRIQNA